MTMLFQKGEDMATNILLVNQKGGVGKTTFADEIAWGLERRGHSAISTLRAARTTRRTCSTTRTP